MIFRHHIFKFKILQKRKHTQRMKHEVIIKYKDLDEQYLEMLIEILEELGLDEKADEIKEFMKESSDDDDFDKTTDDDWN